MPELLAASTPFVFCIDVEPDDREVSEQTQEWRGFEASFAWIQALRPALQAATGRPVHVSWFFRMDPQVQQVYGDPAWAARRYAAEIAQLRAEGDEIGLHVHAWRWDDAHRRWVADHGDRRWVHRCIRLGVRSYTEAFGAPPQAFRHGDHWLDNRAVALLDRLGVRVDLTTEPGHGPVTVATEATTGTMPDYRHLPRRPYRPARADFRRSAARRRRGVHLMPLSAGSLDWPQMGPDPAWSRATGEYVAPHENFLTLNLAFDPPVVTRVLDGLLTIARLPYLATVMRSDTPLDDVEGPAIRANVQHVLAHPLATELAFMRPGEALAALA